MAPLRGTRKKKKTEKRHKENDYRDCSGSSEKDGPLDWWEELLYRTNGLQCAGKSAEEEFYSAFKMRRKTFEYICSLVREDLASKSSSHLTFTSGKRISTEEQVAVAVRRLSSGDSLAAVGELFGANHSTVSQVTWRFVESMETRALRHLAWPASEAEMSQVKAGFHRLPNCCGAVASTRVAMCLPVADPDADLWLDGMLLQAVVDSQMRFRDLVAGWPAKMNDSLVFQSSTLNRLCRRGERLNGKRVEIGGGVEIGEYVVGDSGYPLLPYLVVPYDGRNLTEEWQSEFNRAHFATRAVARRALARLKDRWRIIRGSMWRPDKHRLPRIILVCCLLHNIVVDVGADELRGMDDDVALSRDHDSGYCREVCGTAEPAGVALRDSLALYLSGRLPH